MNEDLRILASTLFDVHPDGLQDSVSPLSRLDLGRSERRLHRRQIVNIHTQGDVVAAVGTEIFDDVRPPGSEGINSL
jgi:hypothetical protein